jgi:hypothetical protein
MMRGVLTRPPAEGDDLTVQRFNLAKPGTCHAVLPAVALCLGATLDEGGFVVKMDTFAS